MVDYKKYIQVLGIIKNPDTSTPEMKASAICELFDQKPSQSIGGFGYVKPTRDNIEELDRLINGK